MNETGVVSHHYLVWHLFDVLQLKKSLSFLQATNEEFKEEFAAAQQTSYGAALGKAFSKDTGGSFLKDLGYDGLGGYGLGLQEEGDSDVDGQEPFEVRCGLCVLS